MAFQVPVFQGFLLMVTLIVAVGAQNAFVLAHAIGRTHHLMIAGICVAIDATLVMLGVAGVGLAAAHYPALITAFSLTGIMFLIGYGIRALRTARRPEALDPTNDLIQHRSKAVGATLAISLLNPHVYLDTIILIGGASVGYTGPERLYFGVGAVIGSVVWFAFLAVGGQLLAPWLGRPRAWRVVNVVIALTMWAIAGSLLNSLVRNIF